MMNESPKIVWECSEIEIGKSVPEKDRVMSIRVVGPCFIVIRIF